MNWKKVLLNLVAITVFGILISVQGLVYAQTILPSEPEDKRLYMGVKRLMESSEPHMGYSINLPRQAGGAVIWNIVKYDSKTSETYHNDNIYCVKAGVGFTESSNSELKRQPYNISYNMKTERDKIEKQNEILKELVDSENTTKINRYNSVLAVLDKMYLLGESTEEEKKELLFTILKCVVEDATYSSYSNYAELIKNAFAVPKEKTAIDFLDENNPTKYELTDYALTDNDIKAVEQAVLWYFTNYGEESNKYDKTGKRNWLHYTMEETAKPSYEMLQGKGDETDARNYQAEVLYCYMIQQAKENADNYANVSSTSEVPIKVETTTLKRAGESDENCILGPIQITSVNDMPYEMDFKVKDNGTETSNYQLLDENKTKLPEGTTVKSLVGKDFYISVPKDKVDSLTIHITVNYRNTTMTLWASTEDNEAQPLAEVHRKAEVPMEISLEPEPEIPPPPPDDPPPPVTPDTFDLKLIKYITAVNDQNVPKRIEKIDVSKLNTSGTDSKETADYKINKEPVGVAKGDIVTYTFRIYNEGMIDGYAQEITEDVPDGLQFLWSEKEGEELKNDKTLTEEEKKAIEFNQKYLWGKFVYDDKKENITQISSEYLSKENETTVGGNLIKAFGHNDGTKTEKDLSYKEVFVKFKVVSENGVGTKIRNEAAITKNGDKDGKEIEDRDSDTKEWVKYEDDEDYDNIILQSFDFALRKFIIAVSDDTKIEKKEELRNEDGSYTRAPIVDTSKLNTKDEKGELITTAIYNHTKEPVIVKPNDIVIYMLRVYNEGDMDGYAAEIKDYLPPYLEYVEGEYNKQYGWQVSKDGRTVTTKYLENSLIKAAEKSNGDSSKEESKNAYVLSYKEVPIMCKVSAEGKSNENRTNIAEITKSLDKNKNPITDRDSQENNVKLPEDKDLPSYQDKEKGTYVPGQQDDDDFEKVNVKIFDLALRKWVTQSIVIENGKQTVTQTGHDAWDEPEAVVKVELNRKKLNQVTVQFRYSIRVYNQGDIEGYAKEIKDYIPEGLKFVAKDNPGWKEEGNNVISTKLLENTLLKPGEYADVQVLLTWSNNENNMGVMNNIAEISKDYNEYGVPDIDSTPNNKKDGEDDIDDAPVMLSISTGQMRLYFTLGFVVLITIAGGVIVIKKFVL